MITLPHLIEAWPMFLSIGDTIFSHYHGSIKVFIKPHPAVRESTIIKHRKESNSELIWINSSLHTAIMSSNVIVSGVSGTLIEAIALGTPAVLVRDPNRFLFDPVPKNVPSNMYAVCDWDGVIKHLVES